jgi:nucleotide-binding universal stress UspA family protein
MVERFRNILFVADREDGLDAALDRAVSVSRTNSARLTVMDVTPDAGFDSYLRRTYAVDLNARLRQQRLESLEALTRPYTDDRITLRRHGIPYGLPVLGGMDDLIYSVLMSSGLPCRPPCPA